VLRELANESTNSSRDKKGPYRGWSYSTPGSRENLF